MRFNRKENVLKIMGQKSNKGLVIALVIAILLALGLGGYIIYDKLLSDAKSKENNVLDDGNQNNDVTIDDNTLDYLDLVGSYSNCRDSDSEDGKCGFNEFLSLEADKTFSYGLGGNQAGGNTTSGTYTLSGNIITFTTIHVDACELTDPVSSDCELLDLDDPDNYKLEPATVLEDGSIRLYGRILAKD